MYINSDCYFIHIPKNGGTFIRHLIKKNINSEYNPKRINFFKRMLIKNGIYSYLISKKDIKSCIFHLEKHHLKISDIHPLLMKFRDSKIEYFCVLRDPIDRFKSLYFQVIKRQNRKNFNKLLKWTNKKNNHIININTYIDFLCENKKFIELQKNYIDYPNHYNDQISKVTCIRLNELTSYMKNNFNLSLDNSLEDSKKDSIYNNRNHEIFISNNNHLVDWSTEINNQTLAKLKIIYKSDFILWDSL